MSHTELISTPVVARGDVDVLHVRLEAKMVVPSAAGRLPTIKAELPLCGKLLRAPQKVRRISK